MVTLLPQTLMKLFVVCVMIGVRTFASFLTFYFLLFYVPCIRFHDNNNNTVGTAIFMDRRLLHYYAYITEYALDVFYF